MPDDRNHDVHIQLGILIGTSEATNKALQQQTQVIERLSGDIQKSVLKVDRLESWMTHTADDVITIRDEMIRPADLNKFGLHEEDAAQIKLDLEHARFARLEQEDKKPIHRQVKSAIIAALAIAGLSWVGESFYEMAQTSMIAAIVIPHNRATKHD